MTKTHPRKLLIAMSTDRRGEALSSVARNLQLEAEVVSDVEALLFRTRGLEDLPEALLVEHQLAEQVGKLDLIQLLRNRKPLAELPIVYLGPADTAVQAAAYTSGIDLYTLLPTSPAVITAGLSRLLERRQRELALRRTLGRLRDFEQAFRESERVKDDLTHMLVHDLKSPISAVMGLLDHSIEMLAADNGAAGGASGIGELLSLARSESQHLLTLAANILDVRRMKEGHMPFEPYWLDNLSTLAHQSLGDVSGGLRERNFSFLVRPEAERIHADPALLRRVLANLFANAVKHTRKGGYIDFRAWKEDEGFVLSVRDDGEGIPEADQTRIFNAFEQSRHTVHDRYDTGMGLTFCKLAVEKHGGKIWVESRQGQGSTFFFTLPVSVEDELSDELSLEVGRG
jgi:signal transduction histidine kinase